MTSATTDVCVVCLNAAHDHNADGVCTQCIRIHRNTYREVLALVGASEQQNNVVLSTRNEHGTSQTDHHS